MLTGDKRNNVIAQLKESVVPCTDKTYLNKYDISTQTYYADEDVAREKCPQPVAVTKPKKEKDADITFKEFADRLSAIPKKRY